MDLDYFKLIDRIVDLNLGERTITVEAQVPEKHTIFEGHFPGFPIMPGVLLTEAMAQSSGWLLLGVLKFKRMPFLAIVKEAKMRGFVSPGELLLRARRGVDGARRSASGDLRRTRRVPLHPAVPQRTGWPAGEIAPWRGACRLLSPVLEVVGSRR